MRWHLCHRRSFPKVQWQNILGYHSSQFEQALVPFHCQFFSTDYLLAMIASLNFFSYGICKLMYEFSTCKKIKVSNSILQIDYRKICDRNKIEIPEDYFCHRFSGSLSEVTHSLSVHKNIRSSCSQMSFTIGIHEKFAIFSRKYLCWSLFLIKVAGLEACKGTGVFLWILQNM